MSKRRLMPVLLMVFSGLGLVLGENEDPKYQKAFDESIDRGLAYLAQHQFEDGSYPSPGGKSSAVVSLCTMAFLAKGYLPDLPPYGDVINRSVDYIISIQNKDTGDLTQGAGGMYNHNISTLMLSEVSGMVSPERQKKLSEALAKALALTLKAQKVNKGEQNQGGWRYSPGDGSSDLSHSGWALMALRSARNNGAAVPEEAINDAVKYIMKCHMKNDGGFGYTPGGGSGVARTGAALLCLELTGRHRDEVTMGAGKYILDKMEKANGGFPDPFFYYGSYYVSQGMYQLGGDEWDRVAPVLYEVVLKAQAEDGSWNRKGGHEDSQDPCYRTAMAILALSVTYKQLPIYQR